MSLYIAASTKLGIQSDRYSLCCECDGTEVDEDVFGELGGQTLMLLASTEQWQPETASAAASSMSYESSTVVTQVVASSATSADTEPMTVVVSILCTAVCIQ